MAKQELASDQPISLTLEQLQELIGAATKAQSTNQGEQFSTLVQAIIESRKPYVDPLQKQNEDIQRQADRRQFQYQKENEEYKWDTCPHKQGLGGQSPSDVSAFWIHRADTGEVIGICSYCQKVISSLKPDDNKFFAMKGGNVPSGAGQRAFLDPVAAMTARFPEEERKAIQNRLYGSRPR